MAVRLKVGGKLILYISVILFIVLLTVTGVSVTRSLKLSTALAEDIAYEAVGDYGNQLKAVVAPATVETSDMALLLSGTRSGKVGIDITRAGYDSFLKLFIETHPRVMSILVLFEPNAFDGKDSAFRGTSLDPNGRYVSYWTRDGNGKGVSTLPSDYRDGTENFYSLSKRSKKAMYTPLHTVQANGKDVTACTLTSPILDAQGNFMGLVGFDINLQTFVQFVAAMKVQGFDKAYVALYSPNGEVLAYPDTAKIGKNVGDVFDADRVAKFKSGKPYLTRETGALNVGAVLTSGFPLEIITGDAPWYVEVSLPLSELNAASSQLAMLLTLVGIASLLVSILVVFLVARSVTAPIAVAVGIAETIAEGDLRVDIPAKHLRRHDEIGVLAKALQNMIARLRATISGVGTASGQVSDGSKELSKNAQMISQGASEQASAVEQISASMEQLVSNIRQNAENAQQTERIARQSAAAAEEGGNSVLETVVAMKQIASKIGIISEIARSTNLLSLNASIEAARAGEYGKGFAVVAGEVGKLAERSQKEAKEISALSLESVTIAEKAGAVITSMVPEIRKTADLVQEISSATHEQDIGTGQISTSILQLDQVIQQNASSAEEAASMSEELSAQSDNLINTISYFSLDALTDGADEGEPARLPGAEV